ncbi:MAG: GNAT family N-acetyltransferase [Gemmatimonadota bacterium]
MKTAASRVSVATARNRGVLSIRPAVATDVDVVVRMRLALLGEESRSPLYRRRPGRLEEPARELTRRQLSLPRSPLLLAELRGAHASAVVGMLRLSLGARSPLLAGGPIATLSMAWVDPQWRRRGVMRSLVGRAVSIAAAAGATDVRLRCTAENVEGNAAWEAMGFGVAAVVRRRATAP